MPQIFVYLGLAVVVVLTGGYFWWSSRRRKKLLLDLNLRLLLVRLPRDPAGSGEAKDPLREIAVSGQFFNSLLGMKKPFALELAVHNIGEEIKFYCAVPTSAEEGVAKYIRALWPGAQVSHADDYTIFGGSGKVRVATLEQKSHFALPLRTYTEAKADLFLSFLSAFANLRAVGEGLALQVVVEGASSGTKKSGMRYLETIKKPPQAKEKGDQVLQTPEPLDQGKIRLVQNKLSQTLYKVAVRLVATAPNDLRAEELLNGALVACGQFELANGNQVKVVTPKNPRRTIEDFIFRSFGSANEMILNTDELASFFHFPTSGFQVAKIASVKSREAAAPIELPTDGVLIGESTFAGQVQPIRIGDSDRGRHIYLIGQTGTGKSNLMVKMALQDIQSGKGVAVVDPHGDLIESLLGLIPAERLSDVILFDPGDIERPLGLNMLENDPTKPEQKTFIVNEIQGIFNKLFSSETMGPMFEQYMRNALLLLMDDPENPATLVEIPRLFSDAAFRAKKLARATNPAVIDFWEKEAVKAGGEASLQNITPYVTSKFSNFIANDYVRPIIGQVQSAFRFREIMDSRKILLCNLSKGKIGDINAGLIGMVVVGKILMAALSRVDTPQVDRVPFNLYIDEFQNFSTDSIATILSEARKYGLNLTVAHQFIAQLTEKIRDAVFGNVGSMVVFRVGAEDAEFLVRQFEPVFDKNDLINIDNYHAYVKLLINGLTARPFNIKTAAVSRPDAGLATRSREASRAKFGRERREVENDILQRLRT